MKLSRCFITVALVLISLQACAWSSPVITWGDTSLNLQLISNPDAVNESWLPQVWYAELPIQMNSLDPVSLNISGDFKTVTGQAVNFIRIKQVVTNNTDQNWTDFHIGLDGGCFYKKWLVQNGWSVVQSDNNFDFYGGPVVANGQTFTDGIVLAANLDANGNGQLTLTKWATVPEPGSILALSAGMLSLLGIVRKRKG